MLIRPHFFVTLALLLAVAGCGDAAGPSGVPAFDGGGPAPPARTLEAPSRSPLRLAPGERATVVVVYRGPTGNGLPNQPVAFSFSGQAHDSSLAARSATTDGAGIARSGFRAGTTPANYRVRADAEDAAPAFVEVSVGTATLIEGDPDGGMSAGP